MMSLPGVDFARVADLAASALRSYGQLATYTRAGSVAVRGVRTVVYPAGITALVGDADVELVTLVLSPEDFPSPQPPPAKFDTVQVKAGDVTKTYTLDAVHPILSGSRVAVFQCTARGGA